MEQNLLQLMSQLASGQAGQLGDLSGLAAGQIGGPTGADQELIAQTIGRAGEAARGALQTQGDILAAQGREQLTSRGVSGSSAEVLGTLLNQLGTQQSISQSILGQQQQGAQALMNLPFQRAQTQLSANQALFNQILGAGQLPIQSLLQERIAQPTQTMTTQQSPLGFLGQAGSMIGGLGTFNLFGNQQQGQ